MLGRGFLDLQLRPDQLALLAQVSTRGILLPNLKKTGFFSVSL